VILRDADVAVLVHGKNEVVRTEDRGLATAWRADIQPLLEWGMA
jgi:hypothetical protein